MKRFIIAIASLLYFAIPAAASVGEEPAEVPAHGGEVGNGPPIKIEEDASTDSEGRPLLAAFRLFF